MVLMMSAVVDATFFMLDNLNPIPNVPEQTGKKNNTRPNPTIDIRELNLFGKANRQTASVAVDAPKTKLNLELQGVFTSDNPDSSAAVVAQKNKAGELYQIGDRLPGNALLDSVYDDHVLIKRGARLEKLEFSEEFLAVPRRSTANATPRQNRSRTGANPGSRLSQIRDRIDTRKTPSAEKRATPGESLREFVESNRDTIVQDPAGALSNLGVTPVTEGEARGYQLGSVPNDLLARAGLQQGDVIMSVNGKPVGNATNDSALLDQALEQKRVRVEVRRDTRRFFLTVPIP